MQSKFNCSDATRGQPGSSGTRSTGLVRLTTLLMGWLPVLAQASMFKGEALDTAADIMAWVVLVIAPIIGISVFWLVHILPEKIAEQKQHPQAKAIQTLCVLSLFFGGLLWPLAWLWAYSKPVLYQLAYGTDKVAHGEEDKVAPLEDVDVKKEIQQLRQQISNLESRLAQSPSGGQASGG